jgi:hypothetical protein
MTVYILGNPNNDVDDSEPTVTKLARQTGFTFISKPQDIEHKISITEDILIRYGYTKYPELDILFHRVINPVSSLNSSINKLLSFKLMQLAHIPMPKLYMGTSKQLDVITPKNLIRKKDLPVLRRKIRHTRGTDIVMVKDIHHIPSGDFYVQYIPTDIEYRVHIIKNMCARIQKKVPKPECDNSFIHNVEHGYKLEDTFEHDNKLEQKLSKIAKATTKALDLDFAAIDILVQKKWYGTKLYVLESNTAPHLDKYGRQLYAWYLRAITIDADEDIDQYDMIEYNHANNGVTVFSKKVTQQ